MKYASKLAALLVTGAVLAACGIGEGSTVEKLEIVPISSATQLKSFEIGDDYKLFQCLRDELLVRATFTDGTVTNFSNRATWSTSDEAIVQVSNGDIPAVLTSGNPANDGSFYEHTDLKYGRGTVIPVGTPGQQATITARFSSLSASIVVEIHTPQLRIAAVPEVDPALASPPYYLGQGTTQRLTVLGDFEGRKARALSFVGGVANVININPFRWALTGGTFVPQDDEVDGDVDLWVIDDGVDRIVELRSTTTDGFVDGVKANFTRYQVVAETSLCQGSSDPTLRPVADVRVATFYDDPGTPADDRLVLSREAGFHGSGFAIEDQVIGSSQALQLRGKLDANGDGSSIVEQYMNNQAAFQVQPLDQTCEDADELLGCTSNGDFVVSSGLLLTAAPEEGDTARIQACHPVCLTPRASLDADDTTVGTGVAVNFTANAINPPSGVTVNYLFDFGDDSTQGPQAGATASHAYATAGQYMATVRLVDVAFPDDFLSPNAGAVRVLAGVTPAAGNTAPTASLSVSFSGQTAPVSVTLNGVLSSDPDTGDSITVYEFNPGDGTPVVRQTSSLLVHRYLDGTGSPFTPTLRVYDESGVASTLVSGTEVPVSGVAAAPMRSNVLDVRARAATLCSAEILPPLAAAASEPAFSFPGLRFDVMGSFVADTATDTCADPVIGEQLITRFAVWTLRPAGVADEVSDIAGVRSTGDDFQFAGQVVYSNDVESDTVLDVTATPTSPFADADVEPTPTQLTVTPCTTCP